MKIFRGSKRLCIAVILTVLWVGSAFGGERGFLGLGKTTLTLDYFIRLNRGGKIDPVTEAQEFFREDKLQFVLEPASDCYAYIILKGSSGSRQVLFPSSGINAGANQIKEDKAVAIPSQGWLTIEGQPGIEHVFFLFSPSKISEIDALANGQPIPPGVLENALLTIRNRQADEYVLTREKERERCRLSMTSPDEQLVLTHDFFIRHK